MTLAGAGIWLSLFGDLGAKRPFYSCELRCQAFDLE